MALTACGHVEGGTPDAQPTPDAAADAAIDAAPWQAHCKLTQPLVTSVQSTSPEYGDACLEGRWVLESLNGTTTPVTVGNSGNTAIVAPTPIPAGANGSDATSTFAVHVSGSGQQNTTTEFSYAQLSAVLHKRSSSQVGTVDASAFTGVQFDAIMDTGLGARLVVSNAYTDPVGGMCSTTSGGATSCYDHPATAIEPSKAWVRYQVPFSDLVQQGYGNPSPLGASFPADQIVAIRWHIDIPETGETPAWELWVDNVAFY